MLDLEIVYGKDRATEAFAEDPIAAARNVEIFYVQLSVTNDCASDNNALEVDSMLQHLPPTSSYEISSKQKRKAPSTIVGKTAKKSKIPSNARSAELDLKELNNEIRGFMKNVSSHFESLSTWMQNESTKMIQVLEELSKNGFNGIKKYKATKGIC